MSRFRPQSDITAIVIHCAATPNGKFFSAEDIDRWHKERGFKRNPELIRYGAPNLKHIGYHSVIYTTGPVTLCRNMTETGAHALDSNYPERHPKRHHYNKHSIGICLIGTDKFSKNQWLTLRAHVLDLQSKFPRIKTIIGHNEISSKACPGFNVQAWLAGDMQPLEDHLLAEEEEPE